jgi:hypothetical protein
MEEWRQFNAIDMVPRKSWPRLIIQKFFEINPLGQIRYFDTHAINYRDVKTKVIDNENYLVTIVGSTGPAVVRARIKVKDLVDKYFGF